MATVKGHGGYIKNITADPDFQLNVSSWEFTKDPRLTEKTHSGTGGYSAFQGTVKHVEWSADVPWDDTNFPEAAAVGLAEGAIVTLHLKLGDAALFYKVTGTTVNTIRVVTNNVEDIVRFNITGKGGVCAGPEA